MPFYFRLNKIKIIDNRECGLWFFRKDLAEIKINSLVATGNEDFSQIETYKRTIATKSNSREIRLQAAREMTSSIIAQVLSSRSLIPVCGIRDNQTITFGDTGFVVYQTEKMPEDFNWCLLVMEDDSDIRNFGASMQNIIDNSSFDSFAENLATIVGLSANPVFSAGVTVLKFVAGIITQSLKKNGDDMAGLLYMSLNQREHYPHGERKANKVADLTGNMLVDYSIFGFENQPRGTPKRFPDIPSSLW